MSTKQVMKLKSILNSLVKKRGSAPVWCAPFFFIYGNYAKYNGEEDDTN